MHGLQQGADSVHHHQPVPTMQPTGGQFSEMFLCSTPIAEWLLVQGNSFFFLFIIINTYSLALTPRM